MSYLCLSREILPQKLHSGGNTEIFFEQKKLFFNFLGADFVAPKSSHQHEKQPVSGPDI